MKKSFRDTVFFCKKTIVSNVFLEIFQNLVAIAAATVMGDFANALFKMDKEYALENLGILIVCIVVNVLFVPAICYWGDTICIKESIRYTIHMFSRFLNMQYEAAMHIPLGEVKSRLESDVIFYRNSIILVLGRLIVIPISMITLFVLMCKINVLYMIIVLIFSFLVLIMPVLTRKTAAVYKDEVRQYQANAAAQSHELILLAPYVKLLCLGKKLLMDYHSLFETHYGRTLKKSIMLQVLSENVANFVNVLATVSVLIVGTILNAMGQISTGDIIAMSGYYVSLLSVMEGVGYVITKVPQIGKLQERVEIFYVHEEPEGRAEIVNNREVIMVPMKLENVSFRVNEKVILKNVSGEIDIGAKVAIVGPNGTGKTTFLNIISGLYRNFEGSIQWGGQNIRELSQNVMAGQYAYVSQQSFMVQDTVRENVRFGNQNCTEEQIDQVMHELRIFHLKEHEVNVKNNNLSGGELQRISLARAILRNKPVLILDEPEKYLDKECKEWIKQFIGQSANTVIYVSHDAQMISLADQIWKL